MPSFTMFRTGSAVSMTVEFCCDTMRQARGYKPRLQPGIINLLPVGAACSRTCHRACVENFLLMPLRAAGML
jgi:hypothetical protein